MNDTERAIPVPGVGVVKVPAGERLPAHFAALAGNLDTSQKFWMKMGTPWPRDALGNTFLGRAVDRVGKAMFPEAWTGFEPSAPTGLRPLPSFSFTAGPLQIREAERLVPGIRPKPNHFHEPAWQEAVTIRRASLDAIGPGLDRYGAVREKLHEALVAGALSTPLLGLSGGEFTAPVKITDWNVPHIDQRFYMCQMHPARPLQQIAVAGDGFHWIFVDEQQLEALVAETKRQRRPVTALHRRAEFCGVLLDAVRQSPTRNPYTREYWEKLARADYQLPRDAFDKVWSEALGLVRGNKWRSPGKRPKSSGAIE